MFTLGLMLPSKFPLFFLQDYSLIVPVSDSDLKKLDGCIPSPPVVFFFFHHQIQFNGSFSGLFSGSETKGVGGGGFIFFDREHHTCNKVD